ncbi:RNA polymerase alpha subunit (chloroplast) [Bryopsis sp. KO-2023]|nr:RNA polymerase alpha subunit [Bryopsis sp. KO-2023]
MRQRKNAIVKKKPSIFSCLETRIDENTVDHTPQLYACFQLGLFPKNQGLTIANALRRTLLTESTNCSITGVLIEDIKHEYSNIKGIKETVFDILMNLKKIIFFSRKSFFKTQVSFLSEKGPIVLKAKNLKLPNFLFCINPDQYITTLETNSKINMTIFIDQSTPKNFSYFTNRYYTNFSNNFFPFKLKKKFTQNQQSNFLFLDTQFCPISNLNYKIKKKESQKEIVFFEIWTNGSVHPNFILKKAIQNLLLNIIPFHTLRTRFLNFEDYENKKIQKTKSKKIQKILSQKQFIQKLIKLDLTNFPISLETYHSLKKLNILTIGDLYILKMQKNLPKTLTRQEFLEVHRLFKYLKFYFSKNINTDFLMN